MWIRKANCLLQRGFKEDELNDELDRTLLPARCAPPDELCCPISHELFENPGMVSPSGRHYDKQSIKGLVEHAKKTQKEVRDPLDNRTPMQKWTKSCDQRGEVIRWVEANPQWAEANPKHKMARWSPLRREASDSAEKQEASDSEDEIIIEPEGVADTADSEVDACKHPCKIKVLSG